MSWPLLNLFGKEMQHIIFYAHVRLFILVVPAVLTKNERHCSRFRNSMSLACWS